VPVAGLVVEGGAVLERLLDVEVGNRLGESQDLANLGNVYAVRGDLGMAGDHYQRALAIDEDIGNRLGQATNLGNLGVIAAEAGDRYRAPSLLQRAEDIYRAVGVAGGGLEIVAQALKRLEAPPNKE